MVKCTREHKTYYDKQLETKTGINMNACPVVASFYKRLVCITVIISGCQPEDTGSTPVQAAIYSVIAQLVRALV